MGWLWIILLGAGALAALAWALRTSRNSILPVATMLLLGVAGYALQSHPDVPGAPAEIPASSTQSEAQLARDVEAAAQGAQGSEQFFALADSFQQKGDHRMAAGLLARAAKVEPGNADLWVAMGNALVLHAGGMVTPAASLAFDRALAIMPDHPGPPFFQGLALAQAGQYDEAAKIWRDLLARTPADAPWRTDLEQRLAGIAAMTGDSGGVIAAPQ